MAGDDALHILELVGRARVDPRLERVGVRVERDQSVTGIVGAARIAREVYRAVLGREADLEIVRPMLAQLLEVSAAVGGGHKSGCGKIGQFLLPFVAGTAAGTMPNRRLSAASRVTARGARSSARPHRGSPQYRGRCRHCPVRSQPLRGLPSSGPSPNA